MTSYFARTALLPDGPARDVRFDVANGRFAAVTPGADATGATVLPGVVLPGLANGHSHAFHRALRGRTHADGGTFWTWRERMYALAARLDPDTYLALARATYAEMALTGFTAVGEFHYLHHAPDGRPYDEPNVMAEALRAAARDAGIRLTLLDACYLAGGLDGDGHRPLDPVQRRFADADVDHWAARVAALTGDDGMRVGAAVHSVRAVPRPALAPVATAAGDRPLHVHLSEQPAENAAAQAFYGTSPTHLLADAGALGPRTTAVHGTHLGPDDVVTLGAQQVTVCFCPTTERDLADGIGPARELVAAGARLSLGSDQHAVIDAFEEARGLEAHERLRSHERGRFTPPDLLAAVTRHDALGWPDAGTLEVGRRADLVAVRDDSVRTAGAAPEQLVHAATASDVDTVLVDGRTVVTGGRHVLGDVGRLLTEAIEAAWQPR
ncbi:formimidoylglutamate deiminase [uncultured Jatrophihabitans sp.]|uniref:formimidoylglutamate deiminase n=1 Tax=uncultured Jatrophihabitans sp. TaxID=1610747 RepID=UPI0035CC0AF5